MPNRKPKYKRVLVKLSGEALMGEQPFGIDTQVFEMMAQPTPVCSPLST